uniref:Uncharacterized protein n=1 Tax=Arundo donax TaxID=35708 RepID=A0A0A9F4N5_ARUDO
MLLGRRDGPTFVEWCNLDKSKRVKPFRCGELDFDRRITNAQALAATGKTTAYSQGRYARMENAVIQALEIERARALEADGNTHHGDSCPTKPNMGNGVSTKSSSAHAAAAMDSSAVIQPPSPKRKRKTPYDSEDDVPKGSRRMRDLRDIGSKTVPMELSNAGTNPVLDYDRPSVSQVKMSNQSHATAKRKHATADQDQPCGSSRKKDRSRPLSELCNGDMWNGSRSSGQRADECITGVGSCSSSSSGTSSLGTSLDKTSSHRSGAFRTDQAKGTEISCMTGLLNDDFRHGHDFVETPLTAGGIFGADHLQTYQPLASTKYPTWKHNKQSTEYRKSDKSSQCERGNFKVETMRSVDQDGNNKPKDTLEHEHHKTMAVKHKAPKDEIVLSEKKPAKLSLNKPAEPGVNMRFVVFPADLDRVGAIQKQRSERKLDREESSETKSNGSNCENGLMSSLVFELPLQVLPPQPRALDLEGCRAVKPIKTLQLNSSLYDVELCVQGSSNKGRRVPLVSLMSKWNRRPVVGYPVSVEVSDDVFCRPSSNTNGHAPASSSAGGLLKKDKAKVLMPSSHTCRAKFKSSRKTSGKEVDKLWQPHTKKPASSPRKMRRLSSFASSRDGDNRKSAVAKVSGPTIACIPLRIVFSRITEALSFPVK